MLLAQQLKKSYGAFEAVKGIDLELRSGEILGLLGPNGAGKSTLIRMVYGASPRTSGDLRVLGEDPQQNSHFVKAHLGVVPQENCLDESLTVEENLRVFGSYHGLEPHAFQKQAESLLQEFNLDTKKSQVIKALSGGMQRRLAFVRALLANPQLLILDEPTTGLDPAVRKLLWEKTKQLNERGVTILLTTHYMEEAEALCTRVVIMDLGSIVAEGSPEDLKRAHGAQNLEEVFLKVTGRRLEADDS